MKTKLFIVFCCALLASCKVGIVTQSQGLSDQGFLLLVSTNNKQVVDVAIDGKTSFEAMVNKEKRGKIHNTSYAVNTGKRRVTITTKQGETLFDKYVIISTQQTQKIILP